MIGKHDEVKVKSITWLAPLLLCADFSRGVFVSWLHFSVKTKEKSHYINKEKNIIQSIKTACWTKVWFNEYHDNYEEISQDWFT